MPTRTLKPLAIALALALAQSQASAAEAARPVYDVHELDPAISACRDFNGYANGRWIAANPIPADKTRWGAFDQLREQSLDAQHKLVDAANANADKATSGSIEQKIGWLYRSGMDEATIDKAGFDPIKPDLATIARINDTAGIVAWLGDAFAKGEGQGFRFGSGTDYQDATRQIAFANQGGLGLPTPDYYSKDEHKDLRAAYLAHIAKVFALTGVSDAEAKQKADAVLAFETRLAKASLSRVELRDPKNRYRFMSFEEANKVTPHLDWNAFFKAIDVPAGNGFSLSQPKFFAEFDAMLADVPTAQWRDYLAFHAIDDASNYLSKPFQDENFAFYGQTLNGQPEQRVRWKRVLEAVNGGMGEALGQLYVKDYFPPEAKVRAQQLVDNVRNALKARIEGLDWMSDETKAKALEKWSTFLPKIGYPDKWRGWDGLAVKPDGYFANLRAANDFNNRYDLDKIGKPTDRYEWNMTPQTVNAYYSSGTNTINFPAAILQPPFFYADGDDAINYGGIGAVIGHEAGHGFDDSGSQFDGAGNNVNWWTQQDRDRFEQRTAKLAAQFDAYVPLADHPDNHVNGKLTMGENIGDLGGLNFAYDALQAADGDKPDPKIDGLSRDQRFFLSWARVWRGNIRDKAQLVLLNADPHSPAKFRAIGAPSNMPAFAAAFQCKAGDPMVRGADAKVVIW
ncbi:peptidase [Pseudoxanthomonas yeongjuensis]|uniref:M13 family metallopeptidase n=1 Tax=Pseudoxanthomonas yeongjuensis TaxID=377616 RepID=UPI001391FF48|nr:M13-type metalloendopeptidase [Pseudoxanthomonas yeongjuensis]KAF1718325.1 peptidase [Pseudoxanthomonas yeongjuensis]